MKGKNVCDSCTTMGWVVLIIGILYLLGDLNVISWWKFNWWTVVFVLAGIKWAFGK